MAAMAPPTTLIAWAFDNCSQLVWQRSGWQGCTAPGSATNLNCTTWQGTPSRLSLWCTGRKQDLTTKMTPQISDTRPCWAKGGVAGWGKWWEGDLSGSVGSNDNKAADDFRVLTTDCWLGFQSAAWLAFLNLLTELKPNQKLKIRLSSYYTNTHTPPLAHIINGNLINDGMAKNHWGDVFWAA